MYTCGVSHHESSSAFTFFAAGSSSSNRVCVAFVSSSFPSVCFFVCGLSFRRFRSPPRPHFPPRSPLKCFPAKHSQTKVNVWLLKLIHYKRFLCPLDLKGVTSRLAQTEFPRIQQRLSLSGVIEIVQKLFIPAWFCMPREIRGKAVKRNIFKKNADDYNSPC